MESLEEFRIIFAKGSKAMKMGLILRELIYEFFSGIDESIVGGAKVKLALYSKGRKDQV